MDREELFLIIGLIGGALISIPIGYFVQYTSNPLSEKYKNWRSRRSQIKALKSKHTARKRIAVLRKRLDKITLYANSPSALIAYCVQYFIVLTVASLLCMSVFVYLNSLAINTWPELLDTSIFRFASSRPFMALNSLGYTFLILSLLDFDFLRILSAVENVEGEIASIQAQIDELQEIINRGSSSPDQHIEA